MALAELGKAVLELSTDDSKLYSGLDKGEKAAVDLVTSFDKAAKAIATGLEHTSEVADQFTREVTAAFTSAEVGSRGVSAAMQKLIGADVIERANAYAKAVNGIGGVSKLTASEQQALFATVNAGIQKYQALGIAAPKALTDTATAAKAAIGATKALDIEAEQLATAMSKVGGASKLAKEDLVQVDKIAADLTAQYAALGREAPSSLKSLQAESAKLLKASEPLPGHLQFLEQKTTLASKATDLLKGSVAQLAGGFAIGNLITSAVGALVSWTKESIEAAGATLDLSDKTGLSTDMIQKMQLAAKLTSATLEDFTGASFKLGSRIAGGSGSVRQAFDDLRKSSGDLGVSWQQLRTMSPDDQYEAIVNSLGKVANEQERNRIAVDLFGKGAAAILPAVAQGWDKITSHANLASRAQLEALDNLSDKWDEFVENQKRGLTAWLGAQVVAHEQISKLNAEQAAQYQALLRSGGDAQAFLLELAKKSEEATKPKAKVDLQLQVPSYVAALKEAEAAVRKLSQATIDEVFAAEKLGVSQDDIINRFGITEQMLALLKERYSDHKTALNQAESAAKKVAEATAKINSAQQELNPRIREAIVLLLQQGNSESDIAAALKVTEVQVKRVSDLEKARTDALKEADKQAQAFVDNQRKMMEGTGKAIIDSLAAIDKLKDDRALQGTSGLNRELIQIEQSRSAAVRAIVNVGDVESGVTKERRRLIDEFYDHQRDVALGTASTLVERMHAHGILTRSELRQQADAFKSDYDQMLASGLYTTEQLAAAWRRYLEALRKVQDAAGAGWQAVGDIIEHIGRQIPGAIGAISAGIGDAVSSIGRLSTEMEAWDSKAEHSGQEVVAHYGVVIDSIIGIGKLMYDWYKDGGWFDKLTDKLDTRLRRTELLRRGGVGNIQLGGVDAGFDTSRLLSTNNASDFARELQRYDEALAESQARLDRYGLSWLDLSDDIQQAHIDQEVRQLLDDARGFDKYFASTAEGMAGVVKLTASGLNQIVVDAVKTGQKIPVALQPMLDTLIRSGQLSDAAAKALLGIADDGVPAFKDIEDAAKRYGIEVDRLGPKVKQIKIDDIAAQIIKDWKLLQSAGADTNTVLDGMADEVQSVVTEALTAGVKIPAGMKPIIEALIAAGRLTDEFGNKLTDTSGIEFEEPITAAIDKLLAKLDELIDKLSGVGQSARFARDEMEKVGQAVPRGTVPAPGTGTGTGTGDDGTGTTGTTGTAQPRPSSFANNAGKVVTDANGDVLRVLGDHDNDGTRRYATGGLVKPLYLAGGGSTYRNDWSWRGGLEVGAGALQVEGGAPWDKPGWNDWPGSDQGPKGTDTIPAWLTSGEYVLDTDTVARQGANALKALQDGAATIVPAGLSGARYDSGGANIPTPSLPALTGLSVSPSFTSMTNGLGRGLGSAGDWNRGYGSAGDRSGQPVNLVMDARVVGQLVLPYVVAEIQRLGLRPRA